jgi:ribokinase
MLLVFGSINVDLVFRVTRLPGPGETVLGPSYAAAPGGKGANQAVAAARSGARVRMVGRVGRDGFAALALAALRNAGVDTAGVVAGDAPTGCAAIAVDARGENQILVASGANAQVTADQVDDAMLGPATTLVLQMELPPDVTAALIARARRLGTRIVLNLAPALALAEEALRAVDVLVVNRGEADHLGTRFGVAARESPALATGLARTLGVTVVLTLGREGTVAATGGALWRAVALPVAPLDTTGAGDAFVGVLAATLDAGSTLADALHRASAAAGIACLTLGAQAGLPDCAAIERALATLTRPTRVSSCAASNNL